MELKTLLVAHNLKKIREVKKLSLDKLADLTGVRKSMLGQIERGDLRCKQLRSIQADIKAPRFTQIQAIL